MAADKQFIVKRRRGEEFFKGFGPAPEFNAVWTLNPDEAQRGDKFWARGQAAALFRNDDNVQQKPVAA